MIEYSEDKQFTTEELGTLFSSVKWEEAKYPARLARSIQGFSLVISARRSTMQAMNASFCFRREPPRLFIVPSAL